MKSYQIIVNGKSYDVDVIPKKNGGAQVTNIRPMVQPAAPAAPAAPAPAPAAPAPAPAAPAATPAAGSTVIAAPLPGVINAVNVKVGDKVKANTVLFVMEAMKMENEIFAGKDGTVLEVHVTKGQTVDTDAQLAVIG